MINLPVDESYAFDFLSILQIKFSLNNNSKVNFHIEKCIDAISKQIGIEKLNEILNSQEYTNLKSANLNTFNLVDLAKYDKVKASDVDYSNIIRFKFRKALQDKFFTMQTNEIKLGYDNAYKDKV